MAEADTVILVVMDLVAVHVLTNSVAEIHVVTASATAALMITVQEVDQDSVMAVSVEEVAHSALLRHPQVVLSVILQLLQVVRLALLQEVSQGVAKVEALVEVVAHQVSGAVHHRAVQAHAVSVAVAAASAAAVVIVTAAVAAVSVAAE